jgi:hypothetical protein
MPKRHRRVRQLSEKRQRPDLRSATAVNLVAADVISPQPRESAKLSISQLPGAWFAFRSRHKRDDSQGD